MKFVRNILYFSLAIIFFQLSFAQEAYYCTYNFERNLKIGSYGGDVFQLQKFLNSDERSQVSATGVGSVGKETLLFGYKTQIALQKFQTLQGLSQTGVFDQSTRDVVNKICLDNKNYFDGKTTSKPTTNTKATSTAIKVGKNLLVLSSPIKEYTSSEFRVNLASSEKISKIDRSAMIIDGASVTRISKLSPKSYVFIIHPDDNSRFIHLQIEAEKVLDTNNNLNEDASNELLLSRKIIPANNNVLNNAINNVFDYFSPNTNSTPRVVNPLNAQDFLNYLFAESKKYPNSGFGESFFDNLNRDFYAEKKVFENAPSATTIGYESNINRTAWVPKNDNSYWTLRRLEFLDPINPSSEWFSGMQFKKEILGSVGLSCNSIYTHYNNQIFKLFETGDKYDYKFVYASNKYPELLFYPKVNYSYQTLSCFNEGFLEPRYFPQGLFCCTEEPCNASPNTTPILYTDKNGNQQIIKFGLTTMKYSAATGECRNIPALNGIKMFQNNVREHVGSDGANGV